MKISTVAARLIQARGARQRTRLLNDNPSLADARLARALKDECYRVWTSAPAEARRVAAALKSLSNFAPETEIEAMRFWVEGIADITAGKLESAVENLDAASRRLRTIKHEHESAQPQVAKLIALAMLGRYDEAQATGRKALKIFERYGDQLAAAKIEMNLSNIVSRRDQYRLAEQYCMSAYRRFESLGERKWQTMAENGLANTYAELNDFKLAEEFYSRALTRARRGGMKLTVAEIEASIGNLALFRGRYADALRHLERSREMYEKLGIAHQTAVAELEIADIYSELNLNAEATSFYRRLIPKLRTLKMRSEEARAHANLGRALFASGELRSARSELRQATALFNAEGNAVAAASVDMRRAWVESAAGKLESALEMIDASMPTIEASENVRLLLSAQWLRGDILLRLDNHDEAERTLTRAMNDAGKSDQPAIEQSAMNSLGKLSLQRGKLRRAERFFESAIVAIEAAREPLPGEEFRMAFLAKTLEPYQNLARLYLRQGLTEDAFVCVERSRSRSLLEGVAGMSTDAGERATTKVREELNRYYTQLDRADDDERSKIEGEIRKRERKLADAALREKSKAGRTRRVGMQRKIDLDLLREKLGPKRALIEFVAAEANYSAFVVTQDIVEFVPDIAGHDEIMELLEGLHFQFGALRFGNDSMKAFAAQLRSRADVYLKKLHDVLIAPLASLIAESDLVIVPAGGLNYVPFHALFDGEKYVVETRDVSFSPSAAVWLLLNSRRRSKIDDALLIAFADEKIPLVEREANELARILPASQKLTGRRATFDAFRSNAGEVDLIHLACHAHFRPDNPMFSSLHLSDGWVTVRDVCSSRLRAELVTLSACETGLSKIFSGEEILGLARGFLSAGARSLVLSLWTVNDEATARLMAEFYSNLQRGLGVSASLRVAQTHFIDRGEHPYYWSPFFAIE